MTKGPIYLRPEFDDIPVTDDEVAMYKRQMLKLVEHFGQFMPNIEWIWTIAICRCALTIAHVVGVHDEDLRFLIRSVAADTTAANPNAPPVDVPEHSPELMRTLNDRSRQVTSIALAWMRKQRLQETDMIGLLLHVYAFRLSYAGVPPAGIIEATESLIVEARDRIGRVAKDRSGGAPPS